MKRNINSKFNIINYGIEKHDTVNIIQLYLVKKGYCLQCNNQNHPGMTCHEASYGSDRLFNEYMSSIGGRVCANKARKAPIERISGCFKVQCSRCKKRMCFKCPANSMIAYDTPEQTYNHLNKIHGGCF